MKAWILMMMVAFSLPALANEEAKEEGPPKAIYVSLTPPFVGNYALDGTAKLHVYKADIALRVTGPEAQTAVKRNDPLIRNQLVALFSQQTVDSMSSADAKEKLRQEALKQVQQVMTDEEGKPIVEDLLFNNLIVQ